MEVKEICDIQTKQAISMTFEQKFGERTFNAHLKEKTYKTFEEYIRKSAADEPCMLHVRRGIRHVTALKKDAVPAVSSTTNDESQASEKKAKTPGRIVSGVSGKRLGCRLRPEFLLECKRECPANNGHQSSL